MLALEEGARARQEFFFQDFHCFSSNLPLGSLGAQQDSTKGKSFMTSGLGSLNKVVWGEEPVTVQVRWDNLF